MPKTLLMPFVSSLLTIPLKRKTKIIVQRSMDTGVDKTFNRNTAMTVNAAAPRRVKIIRLLLPQITSLSVLLNCDLLFKSLIHLS